MGEVPCPLRLVLNWVVTSFSALNRSVRPACLWLAVIQALLSPSCLVRGHLRPGQAERLPQQARDSRDRGLSVLTAGALPWTPAAQGLPAYSCLPESEGESVNWSSAWGGA